MRRPRDGQLGSWTRLHRDWLDYIHRQLGGYHFATRPVGRAGTPPTGVRRYLTFTGSLSHVSVTGVREFETQGATGN